MKRSLIEINKNYGATIDDVGSITTISKKSGEYEFDEILEKENRLEGLNARYHEAKIEYDYNKSKSINAKIGNAAAVLATVVVSVLTLGAIPLFATVVCGGTIYGFGKLLSISIADTRSNIRKEREKLEEVIGKLEKEIPELQKELDDIKDKVGYQEETGMEVVDDDEIPFNIEQIARGEKVKVKIKKLRSYR